MSKISQKEYLKKYLGSDDKLGKKKKKKSKDKHAKVVKQTVKIIDDEASAFLQEDQIDESELFGTNEEAPQIVGVIDERAPDVLMKQEYQDSGKWKSLDIAKAEDKKTKLARKYSSDQSPPRKNDSSSKNKVRSKNRESSNESPPRKVKRESSNESPPRRRKRKSSNESPPRRNKRYSSDASPPRKHKPTSPARKRRSRTPVRKHRSRSPARKRNYSNERGRKGSPKRSPARKSRWAKDSPSPPRPSKMKKTLDGKSSGLQNAQVLRREAEELRARQNKIFQEMDAETSGKHADVVVRERRSRKHKEYEFDAEKERLKEESEAARKKEYDKWGKGLKQIEDIEKKRQEFVHEASKPFARAADDSDLQDYLKDQERADDPMLQYMRKKRVEEKRSKGILEKPAYQGEYPDNRFNIRPGYRWDGVDRSNGYEKKYFNVVNSKKSMEEEAYRYATEDM